MCLGKAREAGVTQSAFVFLFSLVSVRLEAVQQLSVETVSEGSVRVRWRGVSGVRGYSLVWGPFTGQQEAGAVVPCFRWRTVQSFCVCMIPKGRKVETVELASDREVYTLSSLQPDTEYIVTVIPLYEGNAEGPVATARFKIGTLSFVYRPEVDLSPDDGEHLPCCSLSRLHVQDNFTCIIHTCHLCPVWSAHMASLQLSQCFSVEARLPAGLWH